MYGRKVIWYETLLTVIFNEHTLWGGGKLIETTGLSYISGKYTISGFIEKM